MTRAATRTATTCLVFACAAGVSPGLARGQQFSDLGRAALPPDQDRSHALCFADLDGDGRPELLVGNGGGFPAGVNAQNRVYRADRFGGFTDDTRSALAPFLDQTTSLAAGDVDGDGDLDVVVGNNGQNRILLGDGSGRLVDVTATNLPAAVDASEDVDLVDVDGDADLDLVVGNHGQSAVLVNDGSGRFVDDTLRSMPQRPVWTRSIAPADLDGDGDTDLVLANSGFLGGWNSIYENDGTGAFADTTGTRIPFRLDYTNAVSVADVDGDGDIDIVFANRGPDWLLVNDGTMRFTATGLPTAADFTEAVVARDVDRDGDPDLLFAGRGGAELLINVAPGSFVAGTGTRLVSGARNLFALAVADVDGDGDGDVALGCDGARNEMLFDLYRQIDGPHPPREGTDFQFDAWAMPGFANAQQLVVPYASTGLATPPYRLAPLGAFHLDLAGLIVGRTLSAPSAGGRVTAMYRVPIGMSGMTVYMQAAFLHGPSSSDWRFSNVLELTIQ